MLHSHTNMMTAHRFSAAERRQLWFRSPISIQPISRTGLSRQICKHDITYRASPAESCAHTRSANRAQPPVVQTSRRFAALDLPGSHRSRTSVSAPCSSCEAVKLDVQEREEAEGVLPIIQEEFCVVNFYHLVDVPEPLEEMELHRKWLTGKDVQGRIYISSQGINAQCGGSLADARAYAEWVASLSKFQGLRFTVWPAKGRMFPKLRLKFKPSLVSLAGGMTALPVTDPSARATPLQPAAWKQMLAGAQETKTIVLDVRNDYEWDAGHFSAAARPSEEVFNETPVGDLEDDIPLALKDADPSAPIMMYCTGGIRCDIYSTFLKKKGFNNLYSLEGGVQGYLLQEGSSMWDGSLFVFDGRMALPADNPTFVGPKDETNFLPAAIPCQVCQGPDAQLPHINCANIDCNELFIACAKCKSRLSCCCCEACVAAPRLLRPMKMEGYYSAWDSYAEDEDTVGKMMANGRVREGRLARRARRRESLKDKRQGYLDERAARKMLVRAASAEADAYILAQLELGVAAGHSPEAEKQPSDNVLSAAC